MSGINPVFQDLVSQQPEHMYVSQCAREAETETVTRVCTVPVYHKTHRCDDEI